MVKRRAQPYGVQVSSPWSLLQFRCIGSADTSEMIFKPQAKCIDQLLQSFQKTRRMKLTHANLHMPSVFGLGGTTCPSESSSRMARASPLSCKMQDARCKCKLCSATGEGEGEGEDETKSPCPSRTFHLCLDVNRFPSPDSQNRDSFLSHQSFRQMRPSFACPLFLGPTDIYCKTLLLYCAWLTDTPRVSRPSLFVSTVTPRVGWLIFNLQYLRNRVLLLCSSNLPITEKQNASLDLPVNYDRTWHLCHSLPLTRHVFKVVTKRWLSGVGRTCSAQSRVRQNSILTPNPRRYLGTLPSEFSTFCMTSHTQVETPERKFGYLIWLDCLVKALSYARSNSRRRLATTRRILPNGLVCMKDMSIAVMEVPC